MIKKFDTFQLFEIETYQSSIVEKLYELYLKSKNKNISIEDDEYEFIWCFCKYFWECHVVMD